MDRGEEGSWRRRRRKTEEERRWLEENEEKAGKGGEGKMKEEGKKRDEGGRGGGGGWTQDEKRALSLKSHWRVKNTICHFMHVLKRVYKKHSPSARRCSLFYLPKCDVNLCVNDIFVAVK